MLNKIKCLFKTENNKSDDFCDKYSYKIEFVLMMIYLAKNSF